MKLRVLKREGDFLITTEDGDYRPFTTLWERSRSSEEVLEDLMGVPVTVYGRRTFVIQGNPEDLDIPDVVSDHLYIDPREAGWDGENLLVSINGSNLVHMFNSEWAYFSPVEE